MTILLSLWFIIISLVFFYLSKLLFPDFLVPGQKNSKYCINSVRVYTENHIVQTCWAYMCCLVIKLQTFKDSLFSPTTKRQEHYFQLSDERINWNWKLESNNFQYEAILISYISEKRKPLIIDHWSSRSTRLLRNRFRHKIKGYFWLCLNFLLLKMIGTYLVINIISSQTSEAATLWAGNTSI